MTSSDGEFGTAVTDGFRMGVVVYDKRPPGTRIATLPSLRTEGGGQRISSPGPGPTWEAPTSHSRLKPVYDSLQATWTPR